MDLQEFPNLKVKHASLDGYVVKSLLWPPQEFCLAKKLIPVQESILPPLHSSSIWFQLATGSSAGTIHSCSPRGLTLK